MGAGSGFVERLREARTLLFVPGDRPERFAKAAASGADVVVIDLEDAVAPDRKGQARRHAQAWLAAGNVAVVRVNGATTRWFAEDTAAVDDCACVMLPKASSAHVAELAGCLPRGAAIVPLVESAAGVLEAERICRAPRVVRLALGTADLGIDLAVAPDSRSGLLHARAMLVLASAAVGIAPPVDGVTLALDDSEAVMADAAHAAELGFTGKLCVHPAQVPSVHRAFAPTPQELRWARAVLRADEGSAVAVGGALVDGPILRRAREVLRRAAPGHDAPRG